VDLWGNSSLQCRISAGSVPFEPAERARGETVRGLVHLPSACAIPPSLIFYQFIHNNTRMASASKTFERIRLIAMRILHHATAM
jgi:hypothetical protein